jgi:hypothetical protein
MTKTLPAVVSSDLSEYSSLRGMPEEAKNIKFVAGMPKQSKMKAQLIQKQMGGWCT